MECEWTAIENPAVSRCGRPDIIGLENQRHLTSSSPCNLLFAGSIIAGRHSSYLPLVIYGAGEGKLLELLGKIQGRAN